MAKELKVLKLIEPISVGAFKIEVNNKMMVAEIIKYDDGEIKVRYSNENKMSYTTPPVPKEYAKLVWQKAQQQQ